MSERHDYESHSRISILPIVYIVSDYTARAERNLARSSVAANNVVMDPLLLRDATPEDYRRVPSIRDSECSGQNKHK